MNRVVVIGIGNEFRRDDGVGLAVLAAARPRLFGLAAPVRADPQ